MIPYQPPSLLPPPTQKLSVVAQLLIGLAIGVGTLVVMVLMGVIGAELRAWWWLAVFAYIWVLVFIALGKQWYAMIFTAAVITALGAVLGRVLVHATGAG
jgi:hypothetical protein